MARLTHAAIGVALVVAVGALTGCGAARDARGPQIVQPGAPGQPGRVVTAARAADLSRVSATAADVQFMRGMISHHTQAVEMVGLLPSRTPREDMRLLALRIELSQSDEIKMMQRWLEARGHASSSGHAHHEGGAMLMPGMLTPQEMTRLAAATGPAFDRLFLEGMIRHHEGALTMVKELFETPGAGQDAEIFAFASDVDSDQRMEVDRMRALLGR